MSRRILAVLILSTLTIRCATVAHGRGQRVHVTSSPAGANVSVTCGGVSRDAGVTPADVPVRRSAANCSITLTKPGYESRTITLTRVGSQALWWNLAPGFVIGMAAGITATTANFLSDNPNENGNGNSKFVAGFAAGTVSGLLIDRATGAAYKQVPDRIDATLEPHR